MRKLILVLALLFTTACKISTSKWSVDLRDSKEVLLGACSSLLDADFKAFNLFLTPNLQAHFATPAGHTELLDLTRLAQQLNARPNETLEMGSFLVSERDLPPLTPGPSDHERTEHVFIRRAANSPYSALYEVQLFRSGATQKWKIASLRKLPTLVKLSAEENFRAGILSELVSLHREMQKGPPDTQLQKRLPEELNTFLAQPDGRAQLEQALPNLFVGTPNIGRTWIRESKLRPVPFRPNGHQVLNIEFLYLNETTDLQAPQQTRFNLETDVPPQANGQPQTLVQAMASLQVSGLRIVNIYREPFAEDFYQALKSRK